MGTQTQDWPLGAVSSQAGLGGGGVQLLRIGMLLVFLKV